MNGTGKLIVVPTPIGNLSDLSPRVIEALRESSYIACEDTRTTGALLKKIDSKVPAISYHMHNEQGRSEEILEWLKEGKTIALVSDAGMPGISDPGQVLIEKAAKEGIDLSVLPGPCAFVTALVGSGLPTNRFTFIGFLDKNRNARRRQLDELVSRQETLIFYEAPHRLKEFLNLLLEVFGSRQICLARELTKKFEEYERGTMEEIIQIYQEKTPKGEYVILLEGLDLEKERQAELEELLAISPRQEVEELMAQGMKKMAAVKQVAKKRGLVKNDVYMMVTDL